MDAEIQSFKFLLQALALSLLLYISVSAVYYEYLKRGGSWRIASQLSIFIPLLISLSTLLLLAGKLPRFKCKKTRKELAKIENIPVFICHKIKGRNLQCMVQSKKKEDRHYR